MNANRQDAGESLYLARQLESVLPELKDTLYRDLTSKSFIPVNTKHNAGTKNITWRWYTKTGRAKIIAAYGATDIPAVGRFATENTVKVHSVGIKASWSRQALREAAMANLPLSTQLGMDAADANALTIDQATWLGDADHGINGFLNYPGLTAATIPNDGSGGLKTWASKTGSQILRDAPQFYLHLYLFLSNKQQPNLPDFWQGFLP